MSGLTIYHSDATVDKPILDRWGLGISIGDNMEAVNADAQLYH